MRIIYGIDFKPNWPGKPPGLSPLDLIIWQQWHPQNFHKYTKFNYNVKLIRNLDLPPHLTPEMIKMWRETTAKRIDVLGWSTTTLEIIELRDSAGFSAIGHLLGYYHFLLRELETTLQIKPVLITNLADTDVAAAADFAGITVRLV